MNEQVTIGMQTFGDLLALVRKEVAKAYEEAAQICDREGQDEIEEWRGPEEYRYGARVCAKYIRAHADEVLKRLQP